MRPVYRASLVLVALSLAGAAHMEAQVGLVSLPQLKDVARPLLIFAPKPDDPRLEIQVRTLNQHAAEAHDRQLVSIALPYNNPSSTPAQLSPDDAQAARRRFHVAPGEFTVILLGKDGGSKLRADKPFSMEELTRAIDAMPMRREEMQGTPRSH